MYCLDTYALVNIYEGKKEYEKFLGVDFVITLWTLVEFYWVLIRDIDQDVADFWFDKLKPYTVYANEDILKESMKFRYKNKDKKLSYFDCIGYIYSIKNNLTFVTGDKEFETFSDVEFIR